MECSRANPDADDDGAVERSCPSTPCAPVAADGLVQLVLPAREHLSSFATALLTGWSPDPLREEAACRTLEQVLQDPEGFLRSQVNPEGLGPPVRLPDGTTVARVPEISCWLWDGEFCGIVCLSWQPGTTEVPVYCKGHIGYTVVPWKQGRGYAKSGLRQVLPLAWAQGLPFVELLTDPGNLASQAVIRANGGVLIEEFLLPEALGSRPTHRFRILRE